MTAEAALLAGLIAQARSLGASAAVIIPARTLVVEERFAEMCAAPIRCPSYGLAPGCPPHAMSPPVFREQLGDYRHILVFKIDAPVTELMDERRLPIARRIHCIAATLERTACSQGVARAQGLASGSCKELFCAEQTACAVLSNRHPCRHPDLARPSLSALGINFTALAESVGWRFGRIDPSREPHQGTGDEPAMGLMAGLVLLA
jgi:predicted metal-binding protein